MLPLSLNPTLGIPLYRQVMDGIKDLIVAGRLRPGDRLPSLRELAGHLRINPSSVVKAYNELSDEGVIVLDQGRGTFVAQDAALNRRHRQQLLAREVEALIQRLRALGFQDAELHAALRTALGEAPP